MFFSWERRQIKQNLKFSHFWENQFYHKAIAYDKIGGNYALSANSNFACTIHICNGNSSKSYDFHEKYKKIEKWIILVISVNFFEIFTETLEHNIRKSQKICFLVGKEDK